MMGSILFCCDRLTDSG